MNKQQAKEKIKKLVEKYERLSEVEKKRYNEQQTKDHFIRPLFEALGWNFEEDVWPETDVSGKRVDYAFKIGGITKFFIEAKKIPANLDEERWAEQAINYSWHKSVPWVILTDFEAIKVFNTEWDSMDIQSCRFIEIPYTEYPTSEKLWWLSSDAFKKGVLDKEADKVGRRPKKIIDEQLAGDLIRWRDLLNNDLRGYNPKTDQRKISEYTQKILDRLIFIRTLEDRKIEDVILQPLAREWKEKRGAKANQLLFALNKTFRKIDKIYNSGLFNEGACDYLGEKIDADDNTFIEIIGELYKTKDKGIRYNFADIPADIFGGIYEQYLGYIQKEDLKEKKTSKRKSQGIYYTPRYIVDYIVQNTLGEILKDKTPAEIRNLKILDPACGSGSFLISAYQSLINYWQKQGGKRIKQKSDKLRKIEQAFKKQNGNLISSPEKMRILRDNIFGVDLDKEAVELAKLNLLMKMVSSKIKLPKLDNNIQEGNSLISGSERELKKYFGRKWKNKKAFEWKGKFDVVIGNPPYVNLANIKDIGTREYLKGEYKTAKNKSDLYSFFIERAIDLLKDGGMFGFIVSNSWLGTDSFSKFREHLIKNITICKLVKLPADVFKDAMVTPVLIFFKKEKTNKNHKIKLVEYVNEKFTELPSQLSYKRILNSPNFTFSFSPEIKFKIPTVKLGDIAKFSLGIKTSNDKRFILDKKKDSETYPLLRGKDVNRYSVKYGEKWIWYKPKLMIEKVGAGPRKLEYFLRDKIIFRSITGGSIIATFDSKFFLTNDKIHLLYTIGNNYSMKYILGIVNSKLIGRWIKSTFNDLLEIKINQLEQIPIYKIDFSDKKEKAKHDKLVKLADEMLKLNKELQKLDHILDDEEYKEIKEKIEKTDKEIDERVFELYGVTKNENEIVKNSHI